MLATRDDNNFTTWQQGKNQWSYYLMLHPEATLQRCFLGKHVLKICSKFTGEHLCQSDFNKVAKVGGMDVLL